MRYDNGPDTLAVNSWRGGTRQGIQLPYIQQGKPQPNAHVELSTGTCGMYGRSYLFVSIEYAQEMETQ